METVQFYDDTHNPWLNKKKTMTLDLVNGGPVKKRTTIAVLSTPDVQMLKLASPELEKMIISQQGTVCTTPTPTQFICPKNVTDEQAAFAQGFVEALQSLHQGQPNQPGDIDDDSSNDDSQVALMQVIQQAPSQQNSCIVTTANAAAAMEYNPAMHTTTSLPGSTASYQNRNSTIATMSTVDTTVITNGWPHMHHIKQEPEQSQIVPVFHGHGATPPLSPINMESQERIKAERKRLRNRVAASKCRRRKLERISRLEDKVNDLKQQNTDLTSTATKLREQVCQLKQSVMEHVKNGCQVMLAQQLAF